LVLCLVLGCTPESTQVVVKKIPRSQRAGLMVLNFKNNTLANRAREFQPWEFGIASMVMTDLESVGVFNIVSKERLKDILDQMAFQQYGFVDEKEAVKIGRIVAAKFLLTGAFMEMNGNLRIEAQVFSVERGMQLGAAQVTGKTDTFFALEKKLVIKLLNYLDVMLNTYELDLIAKNIETKSIDASLNNYAGEIALLRAEELKEKGKAANAAALTEEAKNNFRAALLHDPNYERAKRNLAKLVMAIPMTL
jgi:TolB-like protein